MKISRIAAAITAVALTAGLCTASALADSAPGGASQEAASAADPAKASGTITAVRDETVYVNLSNTGEPTGITVVNRVDTPSTGTYSDAGAYTSVQALNETVEIKQDGNKLSFELPASDAGFYYSGTLGESAETPFKFTFTWSLDGKESDPADLLGKSGHIALRGKIESNPASGDYFGKSFMCQLQIPLNLALCSNIESGSATSVVSGSTRTLAVMALPGGTSEFGIEFDAVRFEFDGMTASCSPFDLSSMLNIDLSGIAGGSGSMTSDLDKLTEGAQSFADGMTELDKAVLELSDGAGKLSEGASTLSGGASEYTSGVASAYSGAKKLSEGFAALKSSGTSLTEGYATLKNGVTQLLGFIELFVGNLTDEQKASYGDELTMFESQITELKNGLASFETGLSQYVSGVSTAADGVAELTAGLKKLSESGGELSDGAAALSDGAAALAEGTSKLASETQSLPESAAALADGEKQLADGLQSVLSSVEGMSFDSPGDPQSFADPGAAVNSVQFVFRTPAITPPTDTSVAPVAEKTSSFWDKFLALFGVK